jgi:hypothetical protein
MKVVNDDPDFHVVIGDKGQPIALHGPIFEFRPTDVYIKPDGAKDNCASLVIVMTDTHGRRVCGQISAKMFRPVIDALRALDPSY